MPAGDHSSHSARVVQVARSIDEVELMRGAWERLQRHPNADIDLFLAVVTNRESVVRPHVILLRVESEPRAMLIGRLEESRPRVWIPRFLARRINNRTLTIVSGGVLGSDDPQDVEALVEELRATLARGEACVVRMSRVREGSNLHRRAPRAVPWLARDRVPVTTITRTLNVGRTFEEFLDSRSKNTRRNLRRHAAAIPNEFRGRFAVRCLSREDELSRIIRDTEAVAARTYHRRMGVGFVADGETRAIFASALRKGRLRSYVLYIDEEPSAFWNGVHCGAAFHTWYTGFDPAFADKHPGTFLLRRLVEDMCDEPTVRRIDFGIGDARYKRCYCDSERREVSFGIYATSLSGLWLNMSRTLATSGRRAARSVLAWTRALECARRLRRRHAIVPWVRRVMLSVFYRINPGDITIRHHFTKRRFRLHSYKHKGYWFHGCRREREVMRLFQVLVGQGETVIDVGGHIGYTAQYFSQLVGACGHVHVFEPGPNNLPYLRRNVGPCANVRVIDRAVGSRTEARRLYVEDITGLNNSFSRAYTASHMAVNCRDAAVRDLAVRGQLVEVVSLDDYVSEHDLRPGFVKIDTEGFELEVLRGASRLLCQEKPMIMVEIQPRNRPAAFSLLAAHGYLMVHPERRELASSPGALAFNTFCLHPERHGRFLEELGLAAPGDAKAITARRAA